MTEPYTEVLFRVERGLGWITLNRPKAINALDHEMVRHIDAQLIDWTGDDDVAGVVLTGAGDRGLCAGGDIVSIYHDATSGGTASVEFWRDEYVMNARIASYPKPYVAVLSGIVMGGGVGVSAHGHPRIVTDSTAIAMPEVGIGFCPDVGGGWLLSRAPGELGTHLALTGQRFGAGDAILCGFGDHYVPADRIDAMLAALTGAALAAVVEEYAENPPPSPLEADREWIDACYSAATLPEIVERLQSRTEPAAHDAAKKLLTHSPISVSVALRSLRNSGNYSLQEVLDQDLRISTAAFASHDLVEGIRAQVIDKDRTPKWQPATLTDVTPDLIDAYFAPAAGNSSPTATEEVAS